MASTLTMSSAGPCDAAHSRDKLARLPLQRTDTFLSRTDPRYPLCLLATRRSMEQKGAHALTCVLKPVSGPPTRDAVSNLVRHFSESAGHVTLGTILATLRAGKSKHLCLPRR
jgi:hypothetical protein